MLARTLTAGGDFLLSRRLRPANLACRQYSGNKSTIWSHRN